MILCACGRVSVSLVVVSVGVCTCLSAPVLNVFKCLVIVQHVWRGWQVGWRPISHACVVLCVQLKPGLHLTRMVAKQALIAFAAADSDKNGLLREREFFAMLPSLSGSERLLVIIHG